MTMTSMTTQIFLVAVGAGVRAGRNARGELQRSSSQAGATRCINCKR